MKTLIVNGVPYSFPEQGETPTWGKEVTDWATAITDTISGLASSYDLLNQVFLLQNTSTSLIDITNFALDSALVQGAIIDYSIRRTTDSQGAFEAGTMYLSYNSFDPINQKWTISRTYGGDSRCTFYMTDAGQMQIAINDILAGSNFSGRLRYTVRALEV
jgi:hypothetical protein